VSEVERRPFPRGGVKWDALRDEMRERTARDFDFRGGKTSIFFFYADQETYEIGKNAFFEYFSQNALGSTRAYPGLATMERDILDYGLDLLSAPQSGKGVFTTGGTESIFLGIKAAREFHRSKNVSAPGKKLNIVMPVSAHPAFDKAAIVMDIDIRRAPLLGDRRADVRAMRQLVDRDTMALVGSAPCFPHGVIDSIDDIGAIAVEHDVWLHVDSCVGGWVAPFFKRIGRSIPNFDFRSPGVRSISADLHKFGFCPKPASTVFFRNADDLARSTFKLDAWPSGTYITATFCGTRPGGAVAAAWAVLNHLGTTGFEDVARRMSAMTDQYVAGIRAIDGLQMWAEPDVTVLNFGSTEFDIYAVAEQMKARGWLPGLTRDPKGMQTMLAMHHEPAREQYLADLRECARTALETNAKGTIKATY
jgi:sphinganine-1-phosphate aldolase